MAKTREQKKEAVQQYEEKLTNAFAVFFVKPKGISANETSILKKELFDHDSELNVVKNSLFQIALKQQKLPMSDTLDAGEHAIVFSSEKASESAKVIVSFSKKTKKCEIVGGIYDGKEVDASQIIILAELPSKDQLLAQLLSVMNGPIRGLATVLQGNIKNFIYLLNSLKEKKSTLT